MKTRYTTLLIIVATLVVFGAVAITRPAFRRDFGPKSFGSSAYTCECCGSTRSLDRKYILGYIPCKAVVRITYKSPGYASCHHRWTLGVSCSPPKPVPDGTVVLVKEDGKYGAFVLRNQTSSPEHAEYDWWYQADGTGILDTNSPTVTTGHGSTPKIRFGSFLLGWSAHATGSGWLYYRHNAGDSIASNDLHLCITDLSSVTGIDGALPKWTYKATPVD